MSPEPELRCALCLEQGTAARAVFSAERDDGTEVLSCEACLGQLVTRMFGDGSVAAPAWGLIVCDIRRGA